MSNLSDNTNALQDILEAVNELPGSVTDESHHHDDRYYTKGETDAVLLQKSDKEHNHDGRYYTDSETDDLLAAKSDVNHNHDGAYNTKEEINSLLEGKSDLSHSHSEYLKASDMPDIPTKISELTDDVGYVDENEMQRALSEKSDKAHSHAEYVKSSEMPDIPSKISELHDDVGYVDEDEMNQALSEKSNTDHKHEGEYADKTDFDTLKTGLEKYLLDRVNDDFIKADWETVGDVWTVRRWNSGFVDLIGIAQPVFESIESTASIPGISCTQASIPIPDFISAPLYATCSSYSAAFEWMQCGGEGPDLIVTRFSPSSAAPTEYDGFVLIHAYGYEKLN